MMGVYSITNLINGKTYIGKTIDIERRWFQHKNNLKQNKHINIYLQNSWNKYGESNFEFRVLKYCNDEDTLIQLEKDYIQNLKSNDSKFGYNLTSGGEGGKINDCVKLKMSIGKRGQGSNLSKGDVTKIKMLLYCLMDRGEIADIFNVSKKVITQIATGKSFEYVCPELNEEIHNLKQKLIDERNSYILSLFDSGNTIKNIVDTTDYSQSIVEKCVYKYRNVVKENKKKYQEIYEKVFKLKSEGINNYQISKILNISPNTVSRYIDGINNPYKELPFKKITDSMREDVLKMYFEEGKTSIEISNKYNVSSNTILLVINNYKYANTEVI